MWQNNTQTDFFFSISNTIQLFYLPKSPVQNFPGISTRNFPIFRNFDCADCESS